ncbi:MAG: hypothetical protein MUF42_02830 [Cytophagaceae bacterium]|jgi:hypothetical protein|nr:hypothetical protein [Cytophagaceae bacterium]
MHTSRILITIGCLLFLISCNKKPDYPNAPTLEFNEERTFIVRDQYNDLSLTFNDSIVFAFNFTDGDGDLGLDETDRTDNTNINFMMEQFIKKNGVWSPSLDVNLNPLVYKEQFQLLSPKEVKGPLDGILLNAKVFSHSQYGPNDTLKFVAKIKDRAGNFSNTVETPEFIIDKN